jgi:demethylmenaquinone methyltransferase/2-methoxy-6-polyprenyl-1,4-benzoquinol methylase
MPTFDHFGILAPFYDRIFQYQSTEKIVSLADLPVNGRLLDAGGGTGRVAEGLRAQVSQIVVADVSYPMLRKAAEKDGMQTVGAHAEALPFPDDTFDRIIMVDSFHHLTDQAMAARELYRSLKPGGILVIEEPDIHSRIVKLVALFEKISLMRSHFLSPKSIAGLFPQAAARTRIVCEGINAWIVVEKRIAKA